MGIVETSEQIPIEKLKKLKESCRDFSDNENKAYMESLEACFRRNILRRVGEYILLKFVPEPSLDHLIELNKEFRMKNMKIENKLHREAMSKVIAVISEEIEIIKSEKEKEGKEDEK